MANSVIEIKFWGVRGTVAVSSKHALRYGGNTICLAAKLAEDHYLLLDAGSGARLAGQQIMSEKGQTKPVIDVLLSHYHFDHVEGLPLFKPLYDEDMAIRVHGFSPEGSSVQDALERLMSPPFFPVPLSGAPSKVKYIEINGSPFKIGAIQVSTLPLNHPDGCIAYRLEHNGKTMIYATDHEHGDPEIDDALAKFCQAADYLIYDATYQPSEYESLRKGWGHSTWFAGIAVARRAEVKNLVLFHHHPDHTDDELDAILKVAQKDFPNTILATEGESIFL